MLDEAKLRRPGFSEGAAVVLGDGQEWRLPKTKCVFFPTRSEDGKFQTSMRLSYGREYDPIFAVAFRAETAGDMEAVVDAQMNLACMLLSSNYDLTADDLTDLLEVRAEEAESVAWWTALNETALSQAKIPEAAIDVE